MSVKYVSRGQKQIKKTAPKHTTVYYEGTSTITFVKLSDHERMNFESNINKKFGLMNNITPIISTSEDEFVDIESPDDSLLEFESIIYCVDGGILGHDDELVIKFNDRLDACLNQVFDKKL